MENLQRYPCEVNSSTLRMIHDAKFSAFENHTIGIGSKLLKRMGYEGKGLGINGQGIVNPIKVEELPCRTELGYFRREAEKCAIIASEQSMTDDEKPSTDFSKLTVEAQDVEIPSVSSPHNLNSVRNVEIPISGTNMRLLTKTRYKEEELGVKIQGITQSLEVEQRPQFERLGCIEGQ